MNILDIHTHVLPQVPGSALVCIGCGPIPQEQGHWFCAGLHPWDVTEGFDNQLNVLEKLLANPQVAAVGECGFDALKGPSYELQEQAFVSQVQLSEALRSRHPGLIRPQTQPRITESSPIRTSLPGNRRSRHNRSNHFIGIGPPRNPAPNNR